MNQMDRIYKLDALLANGLSRTREELLQELEVSPATFKRDLQFMRDRFNAPITWDRSTRGYKMTSSSSVGPKYELPGLWFNQSELLGIATMQQLLSSMDKDGPIAKQLKPLMDRINLKLGHDKDEAKELGRRVKLISTSSRMDDLIHFEVVGAALVKRKKLDIEYQARTSPEEAFARVVSPQRLMHYRNKWYLGAWCHSKKELRTFSLDSIVSCVIQSSAAKRVSESELEEYYNTGYGIFGGKKRTWAILRFNPAAARYVKDQLWHPKQDGRIDKAGNYILKVPYVSSTELIMDVLRHGPNVEVIEPASLRLEVMNRVEETSGVYA